MNDFDVFAQNANLELVRFKSQITNASYRLAKAFNKGFRGARNDSSMALNHVGVTFEDIEQEMRLTVFLAIDNYNLWKKEVQSRNPSHDLQIGTWINFVKTCLDRKGLHLLRESGSKKRGQQFNHLSGPDSDNLFYGVPHFKKD